MDYLIAISLRCSILAGFAALAVCRVKSASAKHAVWALMTIGMLLQIVVGPVLPALPLPILKPTGTNVAVATPVLTPVLMPAPTATAPPPMQAKSSGPAVQRIPWAELLTVLYVSGVLLFVVRLGVALLFTLRLLRGSERVGLRQYQSAEISVPMTIGSRVLLPLNWRDWDPAKLRAVLAHEESHARRRDWAVALLSHINRCVFWFHPLAWWLERELARLAEQACDDVALTLTQDRGEYARTLLDMARAVHTSHGRLLSAAMAKEANVETRIDRILDETRRIPKALGRSGWAALIAVAAPLIYFTAAVHLAPAQTLMPIPESAAPRAPQLIAQVATPSPEPSLRPQQLAQPQLAAPQASAEPAKPLPIPKTSMADATGGKVEYPLQNVYKDISGSLVYQGKNKTFYFFSLDQTKLIADEQRFAEMFAALQTGQAILPNQVPQLQQLPQSLDHLKVAVDISAAGIVSISVPLDEAGEFDLMTQMRDQDKRVVHNDRMTSVTGPKWSTQVPLAPGTYELKMLVRNRTSGRIYTYQSGLEVK